MEDLLLELIRDAEQDDAKSRPILLPPRGRVKIVSNPMKYILTGKFLNGLPKCEADRLCKLLDDNPCFFSQDECDEFLRKEGFL